MSTKPRKRLAKDERRELIELAATQVFAERGYRGAGMDAIAERSGVSVPVLYDHFASKLDLHRRLLERTRNELLEMWREHLSGDEALESRFPRAIEAWARYVEEHPQATKMFHCCALGDPEAEAVHKEVQSQARVALGVLVGLEPGAENIAGRDQEALEMSAEILRSGLTGLAIWWIDHPHVERAQIVHAALNVVWVGLERARKP
ncbi:MAG: TetR/AcrR family transcriptional regulator [Thermoleophilaceae bacterium]